jgi:toxin HigB-1
MWRIEEHRDADKTLSSKQVPLEILKRYEKWKDIAMLSGPAGLRAIRGFATNRCPANGKVIGPPD